MIWDFTCGCQRGLCALINNPEGIQNPRMSAAPTIGWLDWQWRQAGGCDRGVRSSHSTYFYSSSAPPCQTRWGRGGMRAVWGERKGWGRTCWTQDPAWPEGLVTSALVSLRAVKTVWPSWTPSTSTSENQMQVWKAGHEDRQGPQECSCLVMMLANSQDPLTIISHCISNCSWDTMTAFRDVRREWVGKGKDSWISRGWAWRRQRYAAERADCRVQETWVQISSQPVSRCGTLQRFYHLSGPQLHHL